jgi:hypothetical protein
MNMVQHAPSHVHALRFPMVPNDTWSVFPKMFPITWALHTIIRSPKMLPQYLNDMSDIS